MSALTKLEYERDTNCVEISLFAQCKALISEGMSTEVDQFIERARGITSDAELDKTRQMHRTAVIKSAPSAASPEVFPSRNQVSR